MAESVSELRHPILDDMYALQDAVILNGLGEALDLGHVQSGRYRGNFTPWQDADPSCKVSQLRVVDKVKETFTAFAYPPPSEYPNPMEMMEVESIEVKIVPIIARMYLRTQKPLLVEAKGGDISMTNDLIVNMTQDGVVILYDQSLGFPPSYGEFDDDRYRVARKILDEFSPLRALLEFEP